MFTLNETQYKTLAAIRAWHSEGERRFDYYSRREAQRSATNAFRELLQTASFRLTNTLPDELRLQLVRTAAQLAPNTNLSRRLYSADASDFDRRLHTLLYSEALLDERLRVFLAPRGTGARTASQLLCAFAPDTYPLITLPGLRRLKLTAAQQRDAQADAVNRFGLEPRETKADAARVLLGLFVIYEAIRDALGVATYYEVDELLRSERTAPWPLSETSKSNQVHETPTAYVTDHKPSLTETALLDALEAYVAQEGFVYAKYQLRSYYIALKTKPFAILAGISGSGKTKMAELFAEAMTGHAISQSHLIPVRPDWADATPLLGYQNVLAAKYVSTPFLDLARTAARPENRHKTYFVCLDEMNLARVEHYLSDYLSALESRGHRIPLHDGTSDLILPPNFFVTGTVNGDETTYPFSRKVLDRANTLDFEAPPILSTGDLAAIVHGKGGGYGSEILSESASERQSLWLQSRVSDVREARERLDRLDTAFTQNTLSLLQTVNQILAPHRLHFAYRVRDEVLMFLANSFDGQTQQGLLNTDAIENVQIALDLQIRQKILPKISGGADTLEPLLTHLLEWSSASSLPLSAAKIEQMRKTGQISGYIRFYD